MGVIKQGILGGFSGKVAGVVGSSWKGIAVMKARPLSVANPQTAAQVGQRTKFTAVVERAVFLLTQIVKPLWDRFAQQQSGYNAFVSANIDAYSTSGVLTPADLKTSIGTLTSAAIDSIVPNTGTTEIAVNWTDNSGTGTALATDDAYIVAWNATQDEWAIQAAVQQRDSAAALVDFDSNIVAADVIHAWLAFRRVDGTLVSNSTYNTAVAA